MAIKQRPDSPTNNFCTLNPLSQTGQVVTLSESNLKAVSGSDTGTNGYVSSTISASGKVYYEQMLNNIVGQWCSTGFSSAYLQYYNGDSKTRVNGSDFQTGLGTLLVGDIIGIAADVDLKTIQVYRNGNTFGNLMTGIVFSDLAVILQLISSHSLVVNFGQDPTFGGNKNTPATVNGVTGPFAPSGDAAGTAGLFYYPPPAGFKALCTANLRDFTPTVTGDTPQDYFKAVDYAGDNNTTKVIDSSNGINFVPDLIWVKNRTVGVNHYLVDSVRGSGSGKHLHSNNSDSESTASTYTTNGGIASFGSTEGFTVYKGTDATYQGTNKSGNNFVAWCWKAAGAPAENQAKIINEDGTQADTTCAALATAATNAGASNVITPSKISANRQNGFSIVKWSGNGSNGATVPHGLSSAPDMVIIKNMSSSSEWMVAHSAISSDKNLDLNAPYNATLITSFTGGGIGAYNNTTFTCNQGSTNLNNVNTTNNSYIAYCWHSVDGYSKFGSYTGNGSADGPMVYCGFRPAFLILKSTGSGNWVLHDSARTPSNPSIRPLHPDLSKSETDTTGGFLPDNYYVDFLSNGFKIRNIYTPYNISNTNYIYMAFAEQPFKYSNAR